MENSQSSSYQELKAFDGQQHSQRQTFGNGGFVFPRHRLVLLILTSLNTVLLIAAVVAIRVYCAKAKDDDAQTKLQLLQQQKLNDDLQKQVETLQEERKSFLHNKTIFEETCGKCQPGWVLLNTSCYFFSKPASNPKRNWPKSREDCISRGADLVVIDNWEEQQLLNDNFKRDSTSMTWWENGYWIGLTDTVREGTWVWINNVTEVEQHWIPGEPNNHGLEGENCGAFYSTGDPRKTWYDGKCNRHFYNWICEIKLN